jgi:hypothetical protein
MGRVSHFVNRFNWTLLPAVALAGGLFALGMSYVRDGLVGIKPAHISISVQIDNKGKVKAFEVVDGNLVPLRK